jgi:hypothetical protein
MHCAFITLNITCGMELFVVSVSHVKHHCGMK